MSAVSPDIMSAAVRVLQDIDDLVGQSEGVAGLHLNGEMAEWDSLLSGGKFGAWLESIEDLRAAINNAQVTA
jgi:hypothetical protein